MNRYALYLLALVMLAAAPSIAAAQQSYVDLQGANQNPAGQSYGAVAGATGQAQNQPYYVDPSRFYYNQPPRGGYNQFRYAQPYYYNYGRYGRRNFYYPYCYGWSPARANGFYGGPIYNYGGVPGVFERVGPFIPY